MGTTVVARKSLWHLALIVALMLGVLFTAGLVAAQATNPGMANGHGGALAPVATPPGCVPGWRIVNSPNPNAQYSQLFSVDALSAMDMWAVGSADDHSLIEHWDGTAWNIVPNPTGIITRSVLLDVAAVTSEDVWAVGQFMPPSTATYKAAIFHWDGGVWRIVPGPDILQTVHSSLWGLAAVSANNVWAVGYYQGRALTIHWDGSAWAIIPNPSETGSVLSKITAISDSDIWAVGGGPNYTALLLHWDGAEWSISPNAAQGTMYDVSATSSNDVWVAGCESCGTESRGSVWRWNGTFWSEVFNQPIQFLAVEAIAPDDTWVFGWGGNAARAAHWNGVQWILEVIPRPGLITGDNYFGLTSIKGNGVWGVGRVDSQSGSQASILHYLSSCPPITPTPTGCNTGWNALDSPNVNTQYNSLRGVTVISPSDIWAIGTSGPGEYRPMSMHWDGYAWSIVPMPDPPNGGILRAVSAVASDDVWAVGDIPQTMSQTLTMHWDGSAWAIVPSPNLDSQVNHLTGVAAIAANDVWAVNYPENEQGNSYFALHWNGSAWSTVAVPPGSKLYAVSAVSANDIWAVGRGTNGPLTLHWNGSVWSAVPCPMLTGSDNLTGVSAISTNDVWAVGNTVGRPIAMHWDGTSWSLVPIPSEVSGSFYAVSAASANDVWAVGATNGEPTEETLIMQWDGVQWSRMPSPNPDNRYNFLWGVAAVSPNEVWAVGDQGDFNNGGVFTLVERYVGSCVTPTAIPTATLTATATGTSTAMAIATFTSISTSVPSTATRTPTSALTATATHTVAATGTRTVTPIATSTAIVTVPSTSVATHMTTSTATSTSMFVTTATQTRIASSTAISTSTSIAISTATPQPTSCATSFTDVPPDSTFYLYIRCLACQGIVSGYSDGTFRPNNAVTRGQLSKIVSNAAGFQESPGAQRFEDVPPDNTFYEWVQRLAGRGHIGGYPCGGEGEPCGAANLPYFRPNASSTRGQISKIVSNAAGYIDTPGGQTFEDVPPSSTFYVWIERLASRGIMGGYACGGAQEPCGPDNKPYFRPNANATRGQVSKIVANAFFPNCQTP